MKAVSKSTHSCKLCASVTVSGVILFSCVGCKVADLELKTHDVSLGRGGVVDVTNVAPYSDSLPFVIP